MLRPFLRLIGIAIAGFSLTIVGAQGEIVDWTPSATHAGDIRARLRIDAQEIAVDLRVIKPAVPLNGGTLVIETGKSAAFATSAMLRNMTVATIDLAGLVGSQRGPALRDLIGKLKRETAAAHVLAHGDPQTSSALLANATLFDGLLLENLAPPALLTSPRIITLFGVDGLSNLSGSLTARIAQPVNQRGFYLTNTLLAAPAIDRSCKITFDPASADPARRALLVALEAWMRGVKPPASRLPAAADLAPARTLDWPKIPDFSPPPADDRPLLRIDVDGNQISGLRMPDQILPIATFVSFNARRDNSGKPCEGGGVFPFAATRAAREAKHDPRLSLVERYGSRAYYVATLRVVADRLVRERLLLPQDADAYVAAGKVAPF